MKALEYQAPGQIAWTDVPKPTLQHETDAIIHPLAVASCDLDWEIIAGNTPFPAPFLLGHEFVGEIAELGSSVSQFNIGDIVSVAFQPSCGHCSPCGAGVSSACKSVPPTSMFGVGAVSGDWGGAFADYIRVPFADNMLIKLPAEVPLTHYASATDNVADALRTVLGHITPDSGTDALIFGGYDSIPLYAVAFAKALGARHVRFCTRSEKAARNAEALGAEVEQVSNWPQRLATCDVSVCAVQSARVLRAAIRSTKAGGHCTSTTIFDEDVALPLREMYMRGVHFHTGRVESASVHHAVIDWIASGRVNPMAVDTTVVTFDELIPALLERPAAKLVATASPLRADPPVR